MNDNYKDILLRKFQTMYKTTPRYVELSVTGPPHNRVFEVGVLAPTGKILSRGISTTKK